MIQTLSRELWEKSDLGWRKGANATNFCSAAWSRVENHVRPPVLNPFDLYQATIYSVDQNTEYIHQRHAEKRF
jgi:hypothetical protein